MQKKKISILFSFFFSADVGLWGEKRRKKKKWKNLSERRGGLRSVGGRSVFSFLCIFSRVDSKRASSWWISILDEVE